MKNEGLSLDGSEWRGGFYGRKSDGLLMVIVDNGWMKVFSVEAVN